MIIEDENTKIVKTENYNSVFNKNTGFFARWGKDKDDDPSYAPMPEIADIEISSGMCHNNCPFCYKGNKKDGKLHNMTFDEFRKVFHLLADTVAIIEFDDDFLPPIVCEISEDFDCYKNCFTKRDIVKELSKTWKKRGAKSIKVKNLGLLQQIAFGITSPTDNPDFFKMMEYAREFDVIPNYTCNGTDMTKRIANKTVKLCGAVALSANDVEATYNAIKMLSDKGMKQINIHSVAFDGSFEKIKKIILDKHNDERLEGLNALVLLRYKPKGTNAGKFKQLTQEQYNEIFKLAEENNVRLGFDSCSCHSYLNAIKNKDNYKQLSQCAEPCESTLFSIYVNSFCEVSPCSFCENEDRNGENWHKGINLLNVDDFSEEVWHNYRIETFREKLLANNRMCPMFDLK